MKVSVMSRSGRELVKGDIELKDSAKVVDLQEAIHAKKACTIVDSLVVSRAAAASLVPRSGGGRLACSWNHPPPFP